MNKANKSAGNLIQGKYCASSFTLTFVVEILDIDVFHDCNEGWLDLAPGPVQGMKLQYQLAPGYNFEADIMIWPHIAKEFYANNNELKMQIWCGLNSGWVRTWYFLQRRWLAFSIRHAVPVRVMDFRYHLATVTPHGGLGNLGSNAKSDKSTEVYLPKLSFGERRQFASVCEPEEDIHLSQYIYNILWSKVLKFIPVSYNDGPFDTPQPVTDKRHQDSVLDLVQQTILKSQISTEVVSPSLEEPTIKRVKSEFKAKEQKDKKKVTEAVKFEIMLSGDEIISGTGRIVKFNTVGDKPPDFGEIIVLIGSANLPAPDDFPVVFINIGQLTDVPVEEFLKHRITQLYTKWTIGDDVHSSMFQNVNSFKTEIDFDDHHAVPLPYNTAAAEIMTMFLEDTYKIELRGIRQISGMKNNPTFFGYAKEDRDFGKAIPPKVSNQDTDVLLATTKINATILSKFMNTFIKGEYPMYPPEVTMMLREREKICTNDINAVRVPLVPEIIVPAGIILKAQMTLEVSMGVVGCKPHKTPRRYSRLYCLVDDSNEVMTILRHITEINEHVVEGGVRDDLLTGFALDTGDTVMLYVEGPRDGQILGVWDIIEEFYPKVKPVFSTSAKYCSRLYPDLLTTAMPFNVLKMFVPLSVVLACPPIYVRPAIPFPTRFAVLKIGRLIASKLVTTPSSKDMPTSEELKSFRLELCVAPRPPPVVMPIAPAVPVKLVVNDTSGAAVQRINWEKLNNEKES